MVTMVWVVSRLRLIFIYISPLTSSGQRSRASWASHPQKSATLSPQPGGKTTKFVRTGGGICGGGGLCYGNGRALIISIQFLSKANYVILQQNLSECLCETQFMESDFVTGATSISK